MFSIKLSHFFSSGRTNGEHRDIYKETFQAFLMEQIQLSFCCSKGCFESCTNASRIQCQNPEKRIRDELNGLPAESAFLTINQIGKYAIYFQKCQRN